MILNISQSDQGRNPTVSVILPVYNAERYLTDAVESILGQTFKDFEFLIINDGSTDGSGAILDRYAKQDSRIRLWHRENSGYVSALNFMLGEAKTGLIARMDADDVAMPGRFEVQVAALAEDPGLVLVGGQIELIDADSRRLGVLAQPLSHEEIDEFHLRGHTSVCHPMAMFRRDAVLRVGGYREELILAEDLDLWLRLAEVGRLRNLPEVVLQYRVHDQSVSSQRQAAQADAARRGCAEAWRRRGVEGRYRCEFHNERATAGPEGRFNTSLKYGWMAWKQGHIATARHYAGRALRLRPFDERSLRLAACVMLKQSPAGSRP
jgi:glycosyltransferase involved in cell wall biosynthesis